VARRRLAGLISLALMVAGGLGAHELAYRIVASRTHPTHHDAPAADVHSYLGYLPMCIAVCGAVVFVGLAALMVMRLRLRSSVPVTPPLWLFGIVPPIGFAVQEHLERLVATGSFPFGAALEATFVVGVLLQLPFAVAAYLAARALIALAVAVAERCRGAARRFRRARQLVLPRAIWLPGPVACALALGHGERAPPPTPL
jgi:apolipoprotein N-acyltransferase